jgi:CheY-like chemotaxis protein
MGIVRGHHGAMQVKSEAGKGSVFSVYLPARTSATVSSPKDEAEGAAPLPGGIVLVIDDEETIRRTAEAILEKRGFHVALADTGAAGVEAFRRLSDRIALVLLDLTMPTMSGNEVLRVIRTIRPDAAVIMSSGYAEAEVMRQIDSGDIAGFIQKPYTAAQLLNKVRSALTEAAGP